MNKRIKLILFSIAVIIAIIIAVNQYILFLFNPSTFSNWAYDSLFYSVSIILWSVLLPIVYHVVTKMSKQQHFFTFLKLLFFSFAISLAHQIIANIIFSGVLYVSDKLILTQPIVAHFTPLVVGGVFARMLEAITITIVVYGISINEKVIRTFIATHWQKLYAFFSKSNNYINFIYIKEKGVKLAIDLENVVFFESAGNYVKFHLKNKQYIYRHTIGDLYATLDKTKFLKIHRTYIINLHFVEQVDYMKNGEYRIYLINNIRLNSSRKFKSSIATQLKLRGLPS